MKIWHAKVISLDQRIFMKIIYIFTVCIQGYNLLEYIGWLYLHLYRYFFIIILYQNAVFILLILIVGILLTLHLILGYHTFLFLQITARISCIPQKSTSVWYTYLSSLLHTKFSVSVLKLHVHLPLCRFW